MKKPFKWDDYSDQPALLRDRAYKKSMRKKEFYSIVKTFLTALFMLPFSIISMPFIARKEIDSSEFFCIGVDFQREAELTLKILEELEVKRILVRIKLWEMDSIYELKNFLLQCPDKKVTLKILQDRENVEDLELLEKNLRTLFSNLNGLIDIYEIGSTINRSKWGIFSVDEYSRFYKTAYDLKISEFPDIDLIGSGVIDFEYHFTAHTLFNFFKYKYDGISSLLYVDRRGAPEHTQLGFALSDKIALLSTMVWLSRKSKHILHITETNWPLSGTAPYAPTSEYECVDEDSYTDFMLRYHFLAFASQQVNSLSWHQLMARGYGLIDNTKGITYRPAFQAYKYMTQTLSHAQFLRLDIKRDYYILQCLVNDQILQIHWALKPRTLKNEDFFTVYSHLGKSVKNETLNIDSTPVYIFINKAVPQKVNCI